MIPTSFQYQRKFLFEFNSVFALRRCVNTDDLNNVSPPDLLPTGAASEGCWLVAEAQSFVSSPASPHRCLSLCPVHSLEEIALTSSIYCFHMRAVISLANGNETQNCNKWGHATECRCSPLLAPEYTCPIKLTLTPPPTEQTSLLQTLHRSNLFLSRGLGSNCTSTCGK